MYVVSGVLDMGDTKADKQLQSKNSSFYDYRFVNKLRQAAFLLYQSQPFSLVIKRLEVWELRMYVCMYMCT